jgi:hypothetical protein
MILTTWIAVVGALISAIAASSAWVSNRRAREVNANGQIATLLIQLNQIFVDQSDLRPYFIEGGKLPKGQEQKARALASMYLNILEAIWSLENVMDKQEQIAWRKYTHYQIRSVKIVNDLYTRQEEWYPNLSRMMDEAK